MTAVELQLQPLSATDVSTVSARRARVPTLPVSSVKKNLLNIAFFHATQDPHHHGQAEPLIVISQALGDTLLWKVVNSAGQPEGGVRIEVHSFSPITGLIPSHLIPTGPVPVLFPSLPGTTNSDGVLASGPPSQAAAANDFGWHKFSVSIGNLSLDPCIFVGD
jgi:hypothetical protein